MSSLFTPRTTLLASLLRLLACFLLVAAVSWVGAATTYPEIPTWYAALNKPGWTPPNIAFPIVWTTLYVLMAIALWRLLDRAPDSPARGQAIRLFMIQLALNAIWSPVFFGLHGIWPGLVIILALAVALALTLKHAFAADSTAGFLLVPYLPWVCYAASLNAGITLMN